MIVGIWLGYIGAIRSDYTSICEWFTDLDDIDFFNYS
jgi:hypothetical protein